MSRSCAVLCLILTAATVPAGCGAGEVVAPPQIAWGADICHVCGMIISDDRFAAGLVEAGADGGLSTFAFDDVGCLLAHVRGAGGRVAARFVRDFREDQWRDAETASFVHSDRLHSPMAFGLAACATADEARALLEEYPGEVLDFRTVQLRSDAGSLVMRPD